MLGWSGRHKLTVMTFMGAEIETPVQSLNDGLLKRDHLHVD